MSLASDHIFYEDGLLTRIAGGDEEAFGRLYRETSAGLYDAVMSYVKDPETARDILQQVYIRLWDYRVMLGEVRSVKDYLFILARNAIFDHMRRCAVERKSQAGWAAQTAAEGNDVMHGVMEKEGGRMLRQVVSRLPSQQREAWLLASEGELSYEKIADRMRVSRFTVKRHLELARRFVRKNMHHYLFHEAVIPLLIFCSVFFKG